MANNNSLGRLLFRCFSSFLDLRVLYNDIKNNPEAKKTSTVLGKKAILYWVGFILTLALGGGLIFWGSTMLNSALAIFGIVIMVAGIGTAFYALMFFIISLNATIKQLCLNRKATGWVALSLLILTIVAVVVALLLILAR